jgi:putative oxidoreductase
MAVLRAVARPMLASIFIVQGFDTMRHPDRVVKKAEPVVRPIAERVSVVPDDTETAVRVNGAVQLVAGSLLAMGWLPRISALAIAGTLVPTTAAGHRFWEEQEEQDRAQQRIHFLKNVVMFGGLLIAAADTSGRPSLAWRSRHAVSSARHEASLAAKVARAAKTSGKAGQLAGAAGERLSRAGTRAADARKVGARAGRAGYRAGYRVGKARAKAGRLSRVLPGS